MVKSLAIYSTSNLISGNFFYLNICNDSLQQMLSVTNKTSHKRPTTTWWGSKHITRFSDIVPSSHGLVDKGGWLAKKFRVQISLCSLVVLERVSTLKILLYHIRKQPAVLSALYPGSLFHHKRKHNVRFHTWVEVNSVSVQRSVASKLQ